MKTPQSATITIVNMPPKKKDWAIPDKIAPLVGAMDLVCVESMLSTRKEKGNMEKGYN